jgi:hypothetical protein
MVLCRSVGVRDDDLALWLGIGDVLHDRQHRGNSRAGAGQKERADRDSTRKSPAGALTSSVSPILRWSCRNVETRPSGAPFTPFTRRTVICNRVPDALEETVYCRGCRSPLGRSTNTETYCPGLACGSSPPSANSSTSETTSSVSSMRRTTRNGRTGSAGSTPPCFEPPQRRAA